MVRTRRSWTGTAAVLALAVSAVVTATSLPELVAPAEARVVVVQRAAPGRPVPTARPVGAQRVRVSWTPPTAPGRARVTGYRVTRHGRDARGRGPSAVSLPAGSRTLVVSGLQAGQRYTFSVAATSRSGLGRIARVRAVTKAMSAPGVAAGSAVVPSASAPATSSAAGTPSPPTITASSAGDRTMTAAWAAPTQQGSSAVTGYRVSRDGLDSEGKGPWSTVLPPDQRGFTMTLLNNGTTYAFSVAAINAAGEGTPVTVRLTPGLAPTPAPAVGLGDRPVVAQSAVGQPASLRRGGVTGPRLRMAGVAVWGVPDGVTAGGDFALNQYRDRARIAAAARAWGANHLRLRVLADDYNNDRQGLSKARRLEMIRGWRDAATAQGLYLYVTWWDSLDGYAEDANWPSRYRSAFPMMTDVYRTLGNDAHVFYEPFNEPNSFANQWSAWGSAMRATVAHWRGLGYRGILLIDTPVWSHAYDDAAMTALEQYDATQTGMSGKHQLVFAKHDYANEGWADAGNSFEPTKWRNDTGGSQRHHLIWETEYGNYNGDSSSVHLSWSRQASSFFADELGNAARPNYVGATAFVWGSWWDANALTDGSNTNPTAWGLAVRDSFLRRAAAPGF